MNTANRNVRIRNFLEFVRKEIRRGAEDRELKQIVSIFWRILSDRDCVRIVYTKSVLDFFEANIPNHRVRTSDHDKFLVLRRDVIPRFGDICWEHAIPVKLTRDEMLAAARSSITPAKLKSINSQMVIVICSKAEDKILRDAKLNSKMPDGWDGSDPFARYRKAGIVLEPCILELGELP